MAFLLKINYLQLRNYLVHLQIGFANCPNIVGEKWNSARNHHSHISASFLFYSPNGNFMCVLAQNKRLYRTHYDNVDYTYSIFLT